jgi:hypothetical protein
MGSDLLVTVGHPEAIIPALVRPQATAAAAPTGAAPVHHASGTPAGSGGWALPPLVLTMEETTSEELSVDAQVPPPQRHTQQTHYENVRCRGFVPIVLLPTVSFLCVAHVHEAP